MLKIQTDGSLTPVQALKMGCEKVISHVGAVRSSFKAQCQLFEDQQGLGGAVSAGATPGLPGTAGAPDLGHGAAGTGYGYADSYQRGDEGSGYVDI